MDDDVQQQAEGVDDDVPLAAGDLLARVTALRVDRSPPLWNGPPLSSILFGLVNGEVKGHEVRLMSPEYVRPYVKAQKNDDRDAEAIAEAATRLTMRFVALKTEAQLDVQVLRRIRDRLVGQRTSLMNQIRSLCSNAGLWLRRADASCSTRWRLCRPNPTTAQWECVYGSPGSHARAVACLDARIAALDDEFAEMARTNPVARRLATIPGIGVLNADALVAQSVMGGRSTAAGISRRGSAWCRVRPPRAAGQSCLGSPNEVASIFAS